MAPAWDVDPRLERPVACTEEQGQFVRADVGRYRVEFAVAVQITERDGIRPRRRRVVHLGGKGPVAIAEQDRDRVPPLVRGGHIQFSVAIQIADRHAVRPVSRGEVGRRPERAPARAEHHDDPPAEGEVVRQGRIGLAVAIQVRDGDGNGICVHKVGRHLLQPAPLRSEQHGRAVGPIIDRHHVEHAVAVHVPDCDRERALPAPGEVIDPVRDPSAAIPQQHGDAGGGSVAAAVRDEQVGVSVGVEIAGRDRGRLGEGGEGRARGERAITVSQQHGNRELVIAR